jgi:hypothetical protein
MIVCKTEKYYEKATSPLFLKKRENIIFVCTKDGSEIANVTGVSVTENVNDIMTATVTFYPEGWVE